jgi:hypothetical protein
MILLSGSGASAEQITVETTECYGSGGFSSFDERRVFKIQQGDCDNPQRPGEKLYQILLRSSSSLTRYEVLWVTRDEAKSVMAQTRDNRDSRREARTRPDNVIINVTPAQPPRAAPTPPPAVPRTTPPPAAPVQVVAQQDAEDLRIEVLDPPLTRSANQVLSDSDISERLIVGRVHGPGKLVSLTMNGAPIEASGKGIFRYTMPVSDQRTHVEIIAVDDNGERDTREFWLVLPPKETVAASGDAGDASTFGRYHALVIGINDYAHYRNLETAENDARAIEKLLTDHYGFDTRLLLNPTRYDIIKTMSEMRKALTEKDNLLIYYAGHGEYDRVNMRGHWLPADAEPDSPANWISTIDITDAINRMSAKHIMVIADSCYSGAMNRAASSDLDPGISDEARDRWLQVMARNRARIVLTSGGLEPVLDGGGAGHSIFANALIEALTSNDKVLDGGRLFQQVRDQVTSRANALGLDQVPEYAALKGSNHEFGDFLFVAK